MLTSPHLQHWVKEGCPGGVPVIAGELNRSIGAVERMLGNAPNIKQTTKVPADPPHTHVPLTVREPAPGLPPLPTPWVRAADGWLVACRAGFPTTRTPI